MFQFKVEPLSRTDDSGNSSMAMSGFRGMPLCRFDGRGSVSRFFDDFNSYSELNEWRDEQKLNLLPLCLDGIARDAFDALSESQKKKYADAEAGIRASFGGGGSAVDCLAALRSLRFDGSRPLDAFLIELKKLVNQAYRTASDSVLFNTFLSTLHDDLYAQVVADGIDTFDAAVTKVRNVLTAARHVTRPVRQVDAGAGPHLPPPPRSAPTEEEQKIAGLERRVAELESQLRTASRAPRAVRPRECYACGEVGHFRYDCAHKYAMCSVCGRRGHLAGVCGRFPGNGGGPSRVAGGGAPGQGRPQTQLPHPQGSPQLPPHPPNPL